MVQTRFVSTLGATRTPVRNSNDENIVSLEGRTRNALKHMKDEAYYNKMEILSYYIYSYGINVIWISLRRQQNAFEILKI